MSFSEIQVTCDGCGRTALVTSAPTGIHHDIGDVKPDGWGDYRPPDGPELYHLCPGCIPAMTDWLQKESALEAERDALSMRLFRERKDILSQMEEKMLHQAQCAAESYCDLLPPWPLERKASLSTTRTESK